MKTGPLLIADAKKQSERRWKALVWRSPRVVPFRASVVWEGDRIHATKAAAMAEARDKTRELETAF